MQIRPFVLVAASTLACLDAARAASEPEPARYQVVFERTWSADTHPDDFPRLLAHFSPVIGVTHDGRYAPFHGGARPTAGVEKLCEEGKHQPLDGEIRAAIAGGEAGALIETKEPLRNVPQRATTVFEIDAGHPLVTIAAMIAPSPDWCAVAADVELLEDGRWVERKTLTLEAYDAGTDAATTYRASDQDMQPRGAVQPNELPYFVRDGRRVAVGTVTFVRQ